MIKKLSLVLHDWGGPIGMGYACRNPEKIDKIVVLNTSCFFSSRIPFRIRICRIPGFGPIAVRGFNGFALAALRMAVNHHERMTPEIKRGFVLPYYSWENRIAVLRFVQDIPRSEKDDTFIVIKEIEEKLGLFKSTPILIQWGTLDWCFDKSFLKGWTDRFPQADVDVYEDAAHYVLEDAHERILPHMRDFL
jgi:haloalkane dehalogenase